MFDTIQNIQEQKQVVETTSRNTKTSPCKEVVCWGTGIDSHPVRNRSTHPNPQKIHRRGVVIIGKYSSVPTKTQLSNFLGTPGEDYFKGNPKSLNFYFLVIWWGKSSFRTHIFVGCAHKERPAVVKNDRSSRD